MILKKPGVAVHAQKKQRRPGPHSSGQRVRIAQSSFTSQNLGNVRALYPPPEKHRKMQAEIVCGLICVSFLHDKAHFHSPAEREQAPLADR